MNSLKNWITALAMIILVGGSVRGQQTQINGHTQIKANTVDSSRVNATLPKYVADNTWSGWNAWRYNGVKRDSGWGWWSKAETSQVCLTGSVNAFRAETLGLGTPYFTAQRLLDSLSIRPDTTQARVHKLIAGTGINLSPTNGQGDVTVTATGGAVADSTTAAVRAWRLYGSPTTWFTWDSLWAGPTRIKDSLAAKLPLHGVADSALGAGRFGGYDWTHYCRSDVGDTVANNFVVWDSAAGQTNLTVVSRIGSTGIFVDKHAAAYNAMHVFRTTEGTAQVNKWGFGTRQNDNFIIRDYSVNTNPFGILQGATDLSIQVQVGRVAFAVRDSGKTCVRDTFKGVFSGTTLGQRLPIVTKTADYTPTSNDYMILCNCLSGSFSINLPTAVGIAGQKFVIKKTDATSYYAIVDALGSQEIDGDLTVTLAYQYATVEIISDGTNWYRIH